MVPYVEKLENPEVNGHNKRCNVAVASVGCAMGSARLCMWPQISGGCGCPVSWPRPPPSRQMLSKRVVITVAPEQ